MKAALATATVLVVALATALNLALGAAWVAVLVALLALRRRVRFIDWAVLALALAVGVAGVRLGWLAPPSGDSYARDEFARVVTRAPWLLRLVDGRTASPDGTAIGEALRERFRERRFQELAHAAGDLERQAAAAVAAGRQAGRLAARAPAEAAAVEEAVRRLALTLTAPEFRDLATRRAKLLGWFEELEARLAGARDEADLGAVAQGLEPAAIASVSFRALREDLARVDAAAAALVRAVTGAGVRLRVTSRAAYEEAEGRSVVEDRYVVAADPPLRIVRLDVGALRQAAVGQPVTQTLTYATDPADAGQPVGPPEIALTDGAASVVVVDRRVGGAPITRTRAPLRPLAFWRLVVPPPAAAPDFGVTVTIDGVEARVGPDAPGRRLEGVGLPRHAFHHASLPGRLVGETDGERWVPAEPERAGAAGVAIELSPPTALLRNRAFTALRTYLYVPNPGAGLAVVTLAALAAVLLRRRRARPPADKRL